MLVMRSLTTNALSLLVSVELGFFKYSRRVYQHVSKDKKATNKINVNSQERTEEK